MMPKLYFILFIHNRDMVTLSVTPNRGVSIFFPDVRHYRHD